jgi:hypothetical protein
MRFVKDRPPPRSQVGKPTRQPWLEPPIELAATDVVSVPPAPFGVSSPHKATPSWSNLELVSQAKVLAPPRLPEFGGAANNAANAIAWSRVSARIRTVVLARATWVAAGAVGILAAGLWLGIPLAAAVRTPNAADAARVARDVAIPSTRVDPSVPAANISNTAAPHEAVVAPAREAPTRETSNKSAAIREERQERTQASSRLPKPAATKSPRDEAESRAATQVPSRAFLGESAEPAAPRANQAPASASPSLLDVDTAAEFDRNAAMQALRQAGDGTRSCFAGGAASGGARVAVTFARGGGVSEVVVEPPFAGTPSGNCIAAKFRGLRVPPFRGSSMTVRKTITF